MVIRFPSFAIKKISSYRLKKALPDYQLLINPAVKKDLSKCRLSNGMFIAFPESIKNQVTGLVNCLLVSGDFKL
jgi:hypothetical protein